MVEVQGYISEVDWLQEKLPQANLESQPKITLQEFEKMAVAFWNEAMQFDFTTLSELAGDSDKEAIIKSYQDGFTTWQKNEVHGLHHSYWVYIKTIELAEADGKELEGDSEFSYGAFMRAVLHDMAEFLPVWAFENVTNEGRQRLKQRDVTEGKYKNARAKLHAELMAKLIGFVGPRMGIQPEGLEDLIRGVKRHDSLFWKRHTGKYRAHMEGKLSDLNKYFFDADRLTREKRDSSIRKDVRGAIDRNRKGSLGEWPAFLLTLTTEERMLWSTRTKGLFDGLSALLVELFSAPEKILTPAAREEYIQRKAVAKEEVLSYYEEHYNKSIERFNEMTKNQNQLLYIGLKSQMKELVPVTGKEVNSFAQLQQMAREVMKSPARNLKGEVIRDRVLLTVPVEGRRVVTREYYGTSIAFKVGERVEWFDPSIISFESVEDLKNNLSEAIDDFIKKAKVSEGEVA